MNLYNILSKTYALSQSEDDAIICKKYIELFLKNNNNIDIEYILRHWSKNKNFLYHLLNNNFIYSFPVDIPFSPTEKEKMMYDALISGNGYEFKNNLSLTNINKELLNAINKAYELSNLINNIWTFGSFSFGKFKINNGMKITTAFKKISDYFKIRGYEDFRLAQSRGTNLKNVNGTMNLSIHPIDFFTLADNDCGWDTCLSWRKEGGSCLGCIELMNNTSTVIAYLSSSSMKFDGYTIPNKKWRELFFIDKDFIIEGKAYPYRCDELSKIVLRKIKKLLEINNEKINNNIIELVDGTQFFINNHPVLFLPQINYMYDDFKWIYSGQKRGHYAYFSENFILNYNKDIFTPNFIGKTICLCCGEIISGNIKGQGANIFCATCGHVTQKCDCCGNYCFDNSIMPLETVNLKYCEDCFETKTFVDDISGLIWPIQYQSKLICEDLNKENKIINILDFCTSFSQKRKYQIEKYSNHIHGRVVKNSVNKFEKIYYTNSNDLTPLGKKLFNI